MCRIFNHHIPFIFFFLFWSCKITRNLTMHFPFISLPLSLSLICNSCSCLLPLNTSILLKKLIRHLSMIWFHKPFWQILLWVIDFASGMKILSLTTHLIVLLWALRSFISCPLLCFNLYIFHQNYWSFLFSYERTKWKKE